METCTEGNTLVLSCATAALENNNTQKQSKKIFLFISLLLQNDFPARFIHLYFLGRSSDLLFSRNAFPEMILNLSVQKSSGKSDCFVTSCLFVSFKTHSLKVSLQLRKQFWFFTKFPFHVCTYVCTSRTKIIGSKYNTIL